MSAPAQPTKLAIVTERHRDLYARLVVHNSAEGDLQLLADSEAEAVERATKELQAKVDYCAKMGLRFGMMKTSDKPEPYLGHLWSEDSDHERMFREWSDSIGWEAKLAAEAARADALQAERTEVIAALNEAASVGGFDGYEDGVNLLRSLTSHWDRLTAHWQMDKERADAVERTACRRTSQPSCDARYAQQS